MNEQTGYFDGTEKEDFTEDAAIRALIDDIIMSLATMTKEERLRRSFRLSMFPFRLVKHGVFYSASAADSQ